jgi:hypothetical protein
MHFLRLPFTLPFDCLREGKRRARSQIQSLIIGRNPVLRFLPKMTIIDANWQTKVTDHG